MSETERHAYNPAPLWRRFMGATGCQRCGLERMDPIHEPDLQPVLTRVRGARMDVIRRSRRDRIASAELQRRISAFCSEHDCSFTMVRRPGDRSYLTTDYSDFIDMLRRHWTFIFRSEEEYADCDDHERWVRVWGCMMRLTAIARVHDLDVNMADSQGRPSSHVYNMVVLSDRTVLYDGGSQQIITPGTGRKFIFKNVEVLV